MRGADAAAATSRAVRRPAITSATRGAHRPAIQATGSGRTAFWTTGSGRAALGTTGPAWTASRIGRVPWLVVRWRAVSRACGCTATGARSVQAGGPRRNPTLLTIIGLAVLTQEEVGAYLPGAVFRPNGGNHCDWSVADGGSSPQATGHVTVTVEPRHRRHPDRRRRTPDLRHPAATVRPAGDGAAERSDPYRFDLKPERRVRRHRREVTRATATAGSVRVPIPAVASHRPPGTLPCADDRGMFPMRPPQSPGSYGGPPRHGTQGPPRPFPGSTVLRARTLPPPANPRAGPKAAVDHRAVRRAPAGGRGGGPL